MIAEAISMAVSYGADPSHSGDEPENSLFAAETPRYLSHASSAEMKEDGRAVPFPHFVGTILSPS